MTNPNVGRRDDGRRGTADFHEDGDFVRRSVTIRRPRAEVEQAWVSAGIEGEVKIREATGDRGTELWVTAPRSSQNAFREILGAFLHDDPGEYLSTQLRRFKARLETGEVPTTIGQSSGREKTS
jgi:hypothetical protein